MECLWTCCLEAWNALNGLFAYQVATMYFLHCPLPQIHRKCITR